MESDGRVHGVHLGRRGGVGEAPAQAPPQATWPRTRSSSRGTAPRCAAATGCTPALATSLRHAADGGVAVSDGAFAETKEVIGGYYLIEAADLDEALRIAAQVPAPFGGVEVRPVWPAG